MAKSNRTGGSLFALSLAVLLRATNAFGGQPVTSDVGQSEAAAPPKSQAAPQEATTPVADGDSDLGPGETDGGSLQATSETPDPEVGEDVAPEDPFAIPPEATGALLRPARLQKLPGADAAAAAALAARRREYTFDSNVECPYCAVTPDRPEARKGLHWHDHWRKVGVPEYIIAPTLLGAGLGLQFVPESQTARWDSPILFDNAFRDLLRLDEPNARSTAATITDVLFIWEVAHPLIFDPLIAWAARDSAEVAWQMTVINAQAYGLTLVLNQATKLIAARKRPYVNDCNQDPTGAACSGGSPNSSFYSGHAAVTATSAGLLCAHHTQLHIYGSDLLDAGTCVVALVGSATTGALRIASDNHWATDVIFGHIMGFLSGYLIPTLLYYKEFSATPSHDDNGIHMAAVPLVTDTSFQLVLFGLL